VRLKSRQRRQGNYSRVPSRRETVTPRELLVHASLPPISHPIEPTKG
jgi:hypothetical protein